MCICQVYVIPFGLLLIVVRFLRAHLHDGISPYLLILPLTRYPGMVEARLGGGAEVGGR